METLKTKSATNPKVRKSRVGEFFDGLASFLPAPHVRHLNRRINIDFRGKRTDEESLVYARVVGTTNDTHLE